MSRRPPAPCEPRRRLLADVGRASAEHLVQERRKDLVAQFRQYLQQRAVEQLLLPVAPELTYRRIRELDHVIWPAKHGDQRRGLHEQRVEQSLLEFRLFARDPLTFAQFGIGVGVCCSVSTSVLVPNQ